MRYLIIVFVLTIFTIPTSFASGGPPFDRLYDQEQKPVVKLISQDAKNVDNRKLCLINVAQNKVQKKLC